MRAWKYGLIALGMGFAGIAHAETWHVTSGVNGEEHSTWTFSQRSATGFAGRVDFTDGRTGTVFALMGEYYHTHVEGIEGRASLCAFGILERTPEKASGIESCPPNSTDYQAPWSATIDMEH